MGVLKRYVLFIVVVQFLVFGLLRQAHAQAADPNPGGTGPNYLSNTNPYYKSDQDHGYTLSNPDLVYQCTWYVWGRCADAGWVLNTAPGAPVAYNSITNGSGKGLVATVGSIMCMSYTYTENNIQKTGYHVAYVYHVDSQTSWQIAQYNVPLGTHYTKGTVTRATSDSRTCQGGGFQSVQLIGFLYPPANNSIPSGSITTPSHDGMVINATMSLSGIATSLGSTVSQLHLYLDGNQLDSTSNPISFNPSTGQWTFRYRPATRGLHTFKLTVTDAAGQTANVPRSAVIAVPYDYNGDGSPDLLWYHVTDGHLRAQYVHNFVADSWWNAVFNSMPTDWKLAATADFNNDGEPDLVWYNVNAGHVRIQTVHNGVADAGWNWCLDGMPLDWQLAGVADFDGDGNPDLVWHHVSAGHVRIQPTHNLVADTGWHAVFNSMPLDWRLIGTGDFDGDRRPDFVWYSVSAGHVRIQLVHNMIAEPGWNWCLDGMPLDWQPVGVADYDGDGTPDLVWYHTTAGHVRIKLVHGFVADTGWNATYNGMTMGWRPVGMSYRGTPTNGNTVPIWAANLPLPFKQASSFP